MIKIFRHLWFRDVHEQPVYLNDVAVRIRAGMLLTIPLFLGLTLYDAVYGPNWDVIVNTAVDTYETDWEDRIIYSVEATRRTYDYSLQTYILLYALFEMLIGMSVYASRLSPTILLSSLLASAHPPVWKPLLPKRFAWAIGASLISVCLVFFNPEVFAGWVNSLAGSELLPTTENFIPPVIPLTLVWVCIGFMWLECVLGLCMGCQVHALLVWLKILKQPCEACNNLDWDQIRAKNSSSSV